MATLPLSAYLLSTVVLISGTATDIVDLLIYDEGVGISKVNDWVFLLRSDMPQTTFGAACDSEPAGHCSFLTSGSATKFIRVQGNYSIMENAAQHLLPWIFQIEPDVLDTLIPDDVDETTDSFLQRRAATWGLNRISADSRRFTGAGVTIYVQDTGIRVTHQEFGGRASTALDLTSGSAVECNGDLSCAGDRQGHGTHCAGTAAGQTFGVASEATVKAVKTLSDQGSGSRSWQYTAIDWVTVSGERPAVISMSLGGSGADQGYATVIDAAVASGVVVVVAAGNSNSDACNFSPAFASNAITVGSTTSTDARSSFSNYGSCVEIWAPGSSVLSASSSSNTGSRSLSGTSMACPHVSGAAALVLQGAPWMKSSAVLEELLGTAYLGVLTDLKAGDTNALVCVAEGGAPPTPTPAPTPAPPPGSWVVSGSGCEVDGDCIQSLNHPANYGNEQQCSVQLTGRFNVEFEAFDTESRYDFLFAGGSSYSGTSGPPTGPYSGTITWFSDYSVTRSGWRMCK